MIRKQRNKIWDYSEVSIFYSEDNIHWPMIHRLLVVCKTILKGSQLQEPSQVPGEGQSFSTHFWTLGQEGPSMVVPCTESWSLCSARATCAHPHKCNPEIPLPGREGESPSLCAESGWSPPVVVVVLWFATGAGRNFRSGHLHTPVTDGILLTYLAPDG